MTGSSYNRDMELLGQVNRGVIVPRGGPPLPEGAMVRIVYEPPPAEEAGASADKKYHVQFPLVRTGRPNTLHLTNQAIAEIFDEEDFSPRR